MTKNILQISFLLLLLTESILLFAENKLFQDEILTNPVQNSEKLERLFNYREIEVFSSKSISNAIVLENGYAKSEIINKYAWQADIPQRKVTRIDIVFTKYPVKKEDWITNYHKLLASRLDKLFRLDSSLNSDQIKWNLVLQTGCETGKEAQTYFHGIIIYFETEPVIEKTETIPEIPASKPEIKMNDTSIQIKNYYPVPEKEVEMLYPLKVPEKKQKQKKQEPIKLPDCPDFRKKMFWQ